MRKLVYAQEHGSKEIRLPLRDKLLNHFILVQKKRSSRIHFSHTREVFSYFLFKCFLKSFVSDFFCDPIMIMLLPLMLSQQSLRLSSFFFCFFFFSLFLLYSVLRQWFPPFCLPGHLIHSSASVTLLLIPSSVLFISVL